MYKCHVFKRYFCCRDCVTALAKLPPGLYHFMECRNCEMMMSVDTGNFFTNNLTFKTCYFFFTFMSSIHLSFYFYRNTQQSKILLHQRWKV